MDNDALVLECLRNITASINKLDEKLDTAAVNADNKFEACVTRIGSLEEHRAEQRGAMKMLTLMWAGISALVSYAVTLLVGKH